MVHIFGLFILPTAHVGGERYVLNRMAYNSVVYGELYIQTSFEQ